MSNPGDNIDESTKENYRQIVVERGLSWNDLADSIAREGDANLAAWARSQAAEDDTAAAAKPVKRSTAPAETAAGPADIPPPPPVTEAAADAG